MKSTGVCISQVLLVYSWSAYSIFPISRTWCQPVYRAFFVGKDSLPPLLVPCEGPYILPLVFEKSVLPPPVDRETPGTESFYFLYLHFFFLSFLYLFYSLLLLFYFISFYLSLV